MTAKAIITEIQSVLQVNSTLVYVRDESFFLGKRPNKYKDVHPYVEIDPVDNLTMSILTGGIKEKILIVHITGGVLIKDRDVSIVGVSGAKGVMDLEADILGALYAKYPNLNDKCLDFGLVTLDYPILESGDGRQVIIEGKFTYREA